MPPTRPGRSTRGVWLPRPERDSGPARVWSSTPIHTVLAGLEYGYLGESFSRPPIERPFWFRDDPYSEIDIWATPDESSDYITGVYRQACAHSDITIAELDLDSPGHVAHWADGHQETTLGVLLIRMVGETAQHAGHADIIRELIDGRIGGDQAAVDADAVFWRDRRNSVQEAADHFRVPGTTSASAPPAHS